MSHTQRRRTAVTERLAAWGWAVLAVAATAWMCNRVAVAVEPSQLVFYLIVVATFVLSTLRPVPRGIA